MKFKQPLKRNERIINLEVWISFKLTNSKEWQDTVFRIRTFIVRIYVKTEICKTIIFPVVLYVCETWSLTLREEHKLKVFEKRVLRRVLGLKRD